MKKIALAVVTFTLLFTSCKKKDNEDPVSARTTILTSGKWKLTKSTSVIELPTGTQNVDLLKHLSDCEVDNLFIFNKDNTITTDEGPTKCNPSAPQQTKGGTWSLINSDSQLKLDIGSSGAAGISGVTADIVSMDNNSFVLKYVTTYSGITSTTTSSYQSVK